MSHPFEYIHCDIPVGMSVEEYKRVRSTPRRRRRRVVRSILNLIRR